MPCQKGAKNASNSNDPLEQRHTCSQSVLFHLVGHKGGSHGLNHSNRDPKDLNGEDFGNSSGKGH